MLHYLITLELELVSQNNDQAPIRVMQSLAPDAFEPSICRSVALKRFDHSKSYCKSQR